MIKLADGIGDGVEYVQPVVSSDPDASLFIFHQRGDGAVGERGLVEYAILNKYAAVVAVEASVGTDPENAGFVLEYALNGVVAKAVFNGEAGELERALCRCG